MSRTQRLVGPLRALLVAVFAALLLFLPFMGDALAGYMGRVAVRIATGG